MEEDKIIITHLLEAKETFDILPFKVDVLDYHRAAEEFQKIVDKNKVPFPYLL